MARTVLWKVRSTTARNALVVAEPDVGNYALVYADGLLYKAIKGGTGASVWESEEALDVTSLTASGDITSTLGDVVSQGGSIVAEGGTIIALAGDVSAPVGNVTAGLIVQGQTLSATANTITPKINSYPVNTAVLVLTDAATITTDALANSQFRVTLTATRILANPTNLVVGGFYEWEVIQGGAGSYGLTYGNMFVFAGGAPTLTAAVGAKTVLRGRYNGTHLILHAMLDVKA